MTNQGIVENPCFEPGNASDDLVTFVNLSSLLIFVYFVPSSPDGCDFVVRFGADALRRGLRGLPLRLLLGGLGPLAGAGGSPVATLSAVPVSSSGEASGGSLPLTTGRGGGGLDGSGGLLLSGLLLLGLLLGLGVRVAV
jgi:hypothetical protein